MDCSKLDYVDTYFKQLRDINLTPTLTFNNISINEQQLKDEFCNNLLDIAYENNCYFIVSSDELFNHIKQSYKDAVLICSVIKSLAAYAENTNFDETGFYNEMLDKYDIIVLRPEYVIDNIDNIDKLIKDISRVEVLANQSCAYNCKYHKEHYKLIYERINNIISGEQFINILDHMCPKNDESYKSVQMTNELFEKAINKGIKKIKIQGRNLNLNVLFNDLYNYIIDNTKWTKDEIRNKANSILPGFLNENFSYTTS